MDELVIGGKKFISSKRASEITGYAKDYIGQLARLQKVPATRIGRAWYVDEAALRSHEGSAKETESKEPESTAETLEESSVPIRKDYGTEKKLPTLSHVFLRKERSLPGTWDSVSYFSDDRTLFPVTISEGLQSLARFEIEPENKEISVIQEKNNMRIRVLQAKVGILNSAAPAQLEKAPTAPREKKVVSKIKASKPERTTKTRTPYALVIFSAASFALLIFGSGLFVASHVTIVPEHGIYTANAYLSYEYAKETLLQIPSLQAGYAGIKDFLFFLTNSPKELFMKGIDFLSQILNLV